MNDTHKRLAWFFGALFFIQFPAVVDAMMKRQQYQQQQYPQLQYQQQQYQQQQYQQQQKLYQQQQLSVRCPRCNNIFLQKMFLDNHWPICQVDNKKIYSGGIQLLDCEPIRLENYLLVPTLVSKDTSKIDVSEIERRFCEQINIMLIKYPKHDPFGFMNRLREIRLREIMNRLREKWKK